MLSHFDVEILTPRRVLPTLLHVDGWHLSVTLCSDSCRARPAKLLARSPVATPRLLEIFFSRPEFCRCADAHPGNLHLIPVHKVLHVPDVWHFGQTTSRRCDTELLLPHSFQSGKSENSIQSTADDPAPCNASQSCPLLHVRAFPSP